jgi:hypothetical protein
MNKFNGFEYSPLLRKEGKRKAVKNPKNKALMGKVSLPSASLCQFF